MVRRDEVDDDAADAVATAEEEEDSKALLSSITIVSLPLSLLLSLL